MLTSLIYFPYTLNVLNRGNGIVTVCFCGNIGFLCVFAGLYCFNGFHWILRSFIGFTVLRCFPHWT